MSDHAIVRSVETAEGWVSSCTCGLTTAPRPTKRKAGSIVAAHLRVIAKPPLSEANRFWLKVDRSAGPDGCWLWVASLCHGYGQFAVRGNGGSRRDDLLDAG